MNKFWIGSTGDSELEPAHIGQTIMLEHFQFLRVSPTSQTHRLAVHVGVLAGYTEQRGDGTYGLNDIGYQGDGRAEYPDISMHNELMVVVIFRDGNRVVITERDFASVWMHETKGVTP